MQPDEAEDLGGGRNFGLMEGVHFGVLEYNNHNINK
jgi:hypothetical protein